MDLKIEMFIVSASCFLGCLLTVSANDLGNGTYGRATWYASISLIGDSNASMFSEYQGRGSDGIEARPGEFPYMSWTKARFREGLMPCSGTLISSRWILTDATCVEFYDPGYGIIPVFDGTSPEGRNVKKYAVAQKIPHEGFRWIRLGHYVPGKNNIGLLKMAETIPASEGFTPILLPPAGAFTGQAEMVMPSWGRNSKGQNHKTVRYSKVVIHDLTWCKQFEAGNRGRQTYFRIHGYKMLCNDPAQISLAFDLSSPLVKKGADPSKDVLIGIQSMDIYYPKPTQTVFTDVGAHRDWIKQKTGL